jgi:hypothetical protein
LLRTPRTTHRIGIFSTKKSKGTQGKKWKDHTIMDEKLFDEDSEIMGQVPEYKKASPQSQGEGEPVKERRSTGAFKSLKKKMKKTGHAKKKLKKQKNPAQLEILDYSKRESDSDVLRQCLGVDNYGMCLLHPDQPVILQENSNIEEVAVCKCCRSFEEENGDTIHRRILQRRQWDICTLPLNRNPFFCKYFAMLDAEVPFKDVQHMCYIDRQHPLMLELDSDQSIQTQNKSSLQQSVEQANMIFLSATVEKTAQQVERALRRLMIASSVSVAIEESLKQFRKKQRTTFQNGVARLVNANRFIDLARRTDRMLFDDSKTNGDFNNILRTHLGMDNFGMCLRHPNNQTCSEQCTLKLATVQTCLICKSERLAGGKYQQPKDLKNVVGQITKLQSNKREWHQRTNVLYDGKDYDSIRASTRDETLDHDEIQMPRKSVTVDTWKQGILDRLRQVQAWDSKNALRNNPVYAKYFRLLEIGVPLEALKQTARLDGLNVEVLDLDPNDSVENQRAKLSPEACEELDSSVFDGDAAGDLEKLVGIVDHSFEKRLLAMKLLHANAKTVKKKKKETKKKKKETKKKETKKKSKKTAKERQQSVHESSHLPDETTSEQQQQKKRKLRLTKKIKRWIKSEENSAIDNITEEMEKQQETIHKLEAEMAKKNAIIEALQQEDASPKAQSTGTKDLEAKLEC